MRRSGFAGEFWPSPLQETLLRAALMPDEAASRAWATLRWDLDLDDIWDSEVHRLLPLVHTRLREAGVDDPDMPRLQGLARRTWYENQVRLQGAVPVIAQLEDAGIPTLMLKGMPLAFHHYDSPALRPMRDVDVLVPTERRNEALRLLAAEGWSGDPRFVNRFYHGVGLQQPDGRALDLHWHLGLPFILDGSDAASDADFWSASMPFDLGGVGTRMLCPTDLLLHVCVHGAWSGSNATVRWIADAVTVIAAADGGIDWDRLTLQVERRRLALLVLEPLRYLAEVFAAPVPAAVLVGLGRMPTTRRERACRRRSTASIGGEDLAGRARSAAAYWSRASAKWSRARAIRELPFFFQQEWSLQTPWALPVAAARKFAGRLNGQGGGA